MPIRFLLLSSLLICAAGFESCFDGLVFGSSTPSACPDITRRSGDSPTITIDGYKQDWELNADGTVSANMMMGYTVTSGKASGGFKSISDNADDVAVDELTVSGPNGEALDFTTYVDEGNYRMLQFFFPGDGLRHGDGTFNVFVSYRMRSALCVREVEDGQFQGVFDARWANIWRVPVTGIEYSFTLPSGTFEEGSPKISQPGGLLSFPTYSTPEGKGPRVAYAFSAAELRIGRNPHNIAFSWVGESTAGLDVCVSPTASSSLFLLFLLVLIPCGCAWAYFACKPKPPVVVQGGSAGYGQGGGGFPANPHLQPQNPMYATAVQDSSAIAAGQPLPGQGFIPVAQHAVPSAPPYIPIATPADEPPPYEVAANLPNAVPPTAGKA